MTTGRGTVTAEALAMGKRVVRLQMLTGIIGVQYRRKEMERAHVDAFDII